MIKPTSHRPQFTRVPAPGAEQSAKFAAWYEARFGVVLDPAEASARLHYLTELFLLLGGVEWLQAKLWAQQNPQQDRSQSGSSKGELPADVSANMLGTDKQQT